MTLLHGVTVGVLGYRNILLWNVHTYIYKVNSKVVPVLFN